MFAAWAVWNCSKLDASAMVRHLESPLFPVLGIKQLRYNSSNLIKLQNFEGLKKSLHSLTPSGPALCESMEDERVNTNLCFQNQGTLSPTMYVSVLCTGVRGVPWWKECFHEACQAVSLLWASQVIYHTGYILDWHSLYLSNVLYSGGINAHMENKIKVLCSTLNPFCLTESLDKECNTICLSPMSPPNQVLPSNTRVPWNEVL